MDEQGIKTKIYLDQQKIITDLTDIVRTQNEQSKEDRRIFMNHIKRIVIVLIVMLVLSFTSGICFFYYMYFTSDYSKEIKENNTHTYNNNTTNKNIEEKYTYDSVNNGGENK